VRRISKDKVQRFLVVVAPFLDLLPPHFEKVHTEEEYILLVPQKNAQKKKTYQMIL